MQFDERRGAGETTHHVILEGREALAVSGVDEVERFDETEIVMHTDAGTLVVRGSGLHIETLSLDGGDLKVEGLVSSLTYEDDADEKRGGLFAKLFG